MKFLKVLFLSFFVFLSSLLLPKFVFAEGEFVVDSSVLYQIDSNGKTHVRHDIALENAFSTLYATSYTLTLENIDVGVAKASTWDGRILETEVLKGDKTTDIKVKFDDAVVGRGKRRQFSVSYENSNFAVRTGEVWEISIPKLSVSDSFRNYDVLLLVPNSFGNEAYISPNPSSFKEEDGFKRYSFEKDLLLKTGVTAGFGEFQVFAYTLNYHLENPLAIPTTTEIAIPPDTAFQKVYIHSLNPEPESIRIDNDGNWLASYKLSPRQRVDVVLSGEVQIFSGFRSFPRPTERILNDNLKESPYWNISDPQVQEIARNLKTPRDIYDYVSTRLKYDYARVRPNVERLGAAGALQSPETAICMEFTDLFIALARAKGIPAREVNGYAYTENPEIQPLSLVADVLHAWPEYWDSEKGVWIPVDPTWASTTGGVNFFDKLDLRHFTFVNHGEDPIKPYAPGSYKLGSNPQKDVYVSFGKLTQREINYPEIKLDYKEGLPFFPSTVEVTVSNKGKFSLTSVAPTVYFDDVEKFSDTLEILPPFSSYKTKVKVPYSFLGKDSPTAIKITAGGSEQTVIHNKTGEIIISLLSLFLIFLIILAPFTYKYAKAYITKILPRK